MSTNQATNQIDNNTRSARSRIQRTRIAGAAFVFASTVVVASFIVGSHEPATAAPAETLSQFAARNNLTGLSPASLAPAPGTND